MTVLELKKSVLENPRFLNLADKYLPIVTAQGERQSYESFLSHKVININKDEFLIPVLGVQGAGKSSFLNALLMDDLVLPVDVDETTCVPVEVRYSEEDCGKIDVYFSENAPPVSLSDPKEMEQYVHNNFNVGNEKNVSHIVIYKNNTILKNGVVFVDLPGVDSLTSRNGETTLKYIEKLSAAFFLLRTVPTITRSERIFLSTVWPKLTKAWFIQNQWNDESKKEVQQGMEYNVKKLNEIREFHGTEDDTDIRIVNVFKALKGRMEGDLQGLEKSGLTELQDYIITLSDTWKKTVNDKFENDLRLIMEKLLLKIEGQLGDLHLDRKTLRKKNRDKEREFNEIIQRNHLKISKIKRSIEVFETDLIRFSKKESKKQGENLRNEMRRVTGNRVVDGELLNRSFQDIQKSLALDTMEDISEKLFAIKKELEVEIGELEYRNIDETSESAREFHKEEAFKYEKGLSKVIGVGGSLAGVYAAVAVGAAIGGPFGAVVGGTVMLGVSLFTSLIGSKAKEYIENHRQGVTMEEMEGPIQEFQKNFYENVREKVETFFKSINYSLSQFIESQERELTVEMEENRTNSRLTEDEVTVRRAQLEEDLLYLQNFRGNGQ